MNLSFADTLYFKKENILEIILGLHRSYKSLQREIQTCCEINNLTFNELLVLLEIKKKYNKKTDIANKVFLKKQNLNLILKDLIKKKIIVNEGKKILITASGNATIDKTVTRINEKIIKIFQKTDPRNMAGFINIIESI
jgi:predicted transcriptional regulator|tara:strand:- start:230 stop:646 length:417 start_codon:yes stop_codon:yes gene_type:complete